MDWQIQIEKKAQKSLSKIPNPYKDNIIEAIDDLENNPRPYNTKKLKGGDDLWRIRVQDYRIVYKVQDNKDYFNYPDCTPQRCLSQFVNGVAALHFPY